MNQGLAFPVIVNQSVLQAALSQKEEIRFMKQTNGTTVCSYLISAPDTFDSPEAREARGLVFDAEGKMIARPLHKFFNVGERESTRLENIDFTKVVRVMDKRDGSMIHTVALSSELGNFSLKSKKSFESDVAKQATQWIKNAPGFVALCSEMTKVGETVIFEWTSPVARIVLAYPNDELRLLHVRNNETGEYHTQEQLEVLSARYGVKLVDTRDDILMMMLESDRKDLTLQSLVEETDGIEGWIFQFENGDMVKVKTKWYLERHRAMTFLRVRDIARMTLREETDDLKSLLVGEGADISEIEAIENSVVAEINYIRERVDLAYLPNAALSRKDFAIMMNSHPYFSLLMTRYSGKEINVNEWFERNVLDEKYDLRQINLIQSVAEAE